MSIKSTLGLVVVLAAGPLAAGAAQSVGGRAFGVFVNTPVAAQAQSPLATLPAISGTDGDIAHADADGLSVPNALSSGLASSTATGAIGAAATSAADTSRSYTTTSAERRSSRPFAVIKPGSPGPAPTR